MDRAIDDPHKLTDDLVDHFAEHFDHHDPRYGQDPYPVLRKMQSKCPISWSDNYDGFWIVTGYDAAHWVWQNHELFATQPSVSVPAGLGNHRPLLPLEVDPPVHGKYRALLAPVFSPRRIEAMEDEIRGIMNGLVDSFLADGECEFISQVAQPLPTAIFVQMLGIPPAEAADFKQWNYDILHGQHRDPSGGLRAAAGKAARDRLREIMEDRKRERNDDLISLLLDSEVDGEKLGEEELLDTAFLLFLAGLDTVQGALGFQFTYLATHPEQRDRLVADPALIPNAVEELLRWEGLNISGRNVTQDCEYEGIALRKGDPIVIVNRIANRDPEMFDRPEEVDFDRPPTRNLAFAAGPHRCVGSHLARLEMRVVHEVMHERIPGYTLKPGHVVSIHGGNVAGVDALPLVWGPAA